MTRDYNYGHKVMLVLDGAENIPEGLKKFNQQVFRVSDIKKFNLKGTCKYITLYELDGCVSDKGVPYTLIEDWLYDIGAWVE